MIAKITATVAATRLSSSKQLFSWKKTAQTYVRRAEKPLRRNPLLSMAILIGLLFVVIAIGSQMRKPQITDEAVMSEPREVAVFYVGEAPTITTSGKVDKTGVVQILAQSGGVVQDVRVIPGQTVKPGHTLARLSTNYTGGSVPSVQKAIAAKQYQQAKESRVLQLEALDLQRSIATASAEGAAQQRDIQAAALGDTREILELTELQLETLDESLSVATASADLQLLRQQRSQLLSTASQLRTSIRNLQYAESDTTPTVQLENFQKELTLKQLEIQEKSLALSEDVARLQYQLARIQESLLYPAAPFAGVVERVFVSKGESVSPGQVIATLKCDILATQVTALVSPALAEQISSLELATLSNGDTTLRLYPNYISTVATEGSLHSVQFMIPTEYFYAFTNQDIVRISLPLAVARSQTSIPYIPIDAVYQTESLANVLVVSEDGTAESREIVTGQVTGRFVSVLSGLDATAQVIVDRSVVAGERVIPHNDTASELSQKE